MQTQLADFLKDTNTGAEIEKILRSCVHCGFCNATCPSYTVLGNELDGPRGRIYQIKKFTETGQVSESVQQHLDRCLTCLACTTTCPSGVQYNRLIDIGRELVDQRLDRPLPQSVLRSLLAGIVPNRRVFSALLFVGRLFRPFLPRTLKDKIAPRQKKTLPAPQTKHDRKMLVLAGCAQPSLTPNTNIALSIVLDRLGIALNTASRAGCCGAVKQHLTEPMRAREEMKRNIDAWWPYVESGYEAIIVSASGCGVMVKDYAWHLRADTEYSGKAQRISALCKDPVEVLQNENLTDFAVGQERLIAYHSPCSLQHGQKLAGSVEALLKNAGFRLTSVPESHLCCGSAGTYSILQSDISAKLKTRKLQNLQSQQPELIATANVGCQTHLQTGTKVPVVHWLELLSGHY